MEACENPFPADFQGEIDLVHGWSPPLSHGFRSTAFSPEEDTDLTNDLTSIDPVCTRHQDNLGPL
jgi:hypothetical protein